VFTVENVIRGLCLSALVVFAQAAQAQLAVIDVDAIAHLIEELQALQDQLDVARTHLAQARQEYEAITGPRGMERLLQGIERNYLPENWAELVQVMQGGPDGYAALAASVQSLITENAVLTEDQLAALPPADRRRIEGLRSSAALHQALARQALQTTSERFASIQGLIDAIPSAADQKAILDLHARIGAEQGMLQNEQTKMQILYAVSQADDRAERQIVRERVLSGHGRFESRFHPVP
jgi:type IV secretion system protein VirB5